MPELTGQPVIRHAWRPRADLDNIHYLAVAGDMVSHLRTKPGEPLYDILAEALRLTGRDEGARPSYPGRSSVTRSVGVPLLDSRCT